MANPEENYIEVNKNLWNKRTEIHISSDFYDVPKFVAGQSSLNSIELDLLGDVKGKSILHLQCHFGQDTLSLARMGALVTGVDFSETAIDAAGKLAQEMSLDAQFICCDIYDLPENLSGQFDIVFTSYGTIGWLPDLEKWSAVVAHYLKPNGLFIMADFHPVIWMFDNAFEKIQYRYFKSEAIIETSNGTYANKDSEIIAEEISWNHSLDEILSNLLDKGLSLQSFKEFDYSPYSCFKNMVEDEPQKFRFKHWQNKLPMIYSIKAKKAE